MYTIFFLVTRVKMMPTYGEFLFSAPGGFVRMLHYYKGYNLMSYGFQEKVRRKPLLQNIICNVIYSHRKNVKFTLM